jgi:hypothetical protein
LKRYKADGKRWNKFFFEKFMKRSCAAQEDPTDSINPTNSTNPIDSTDPTDSTNSIPSMNSIK